MKTYVALLPIAVALFTAEGVHSQASKNAFLLLIPYAASVNSCAAYGTDMRTKLKKALATAQLNSGKILPPAAWEVIGQGSNSNTEKSAGPAEGARCDALLGLLEDSNFAVHFRQGIASTFVLKPALVCIAEHPSTAENIKTAWLSAFDRQGFSLSAKALDDLTSHASLQTMKQPVGKGPSSAECEQFAADLSGPQFDAGYGEDGILKLFTNKK